MTPKASPPRALYPRRGITLVALVAGSLVTAACHGAANTVDFDHARLSWTPGVGGGTTTTFRVKCGVAAGAYTLTADVAPPATSILVKTVVRTPGTYYCVVTAANQFGESVPSKEVKFTAAAATAR